ncbi:unnamed protein product [Brassica oleracea]
MEILCLLTITLSSQITWPILSLLKPRLGLRVRLSRDLLRSMRSSLAGGEDLRWKHRGTVSPEL